METLFIGQNAIFLPQVESTNSYAIELLKNVNLIEGSMIYSTNQTNGRGQRGNTWVTEAGLNVAISYVLKPNFLSLDKLFYIYIVSALAVHDLMAELLDSSQFDIKIKWPNDILINSKKIAGILNENIISNGKVSNSVVGIGLNLNQTDFNGLLNATSLALLTSQKYDVSTILKQLSKHFEHYYIKLKNNHFEGLLKEYYKHFFKLGCKQNFIFNKHEELFEIKGINNVGLLHLADKNNTDYYFDVKEVSWV